ncbi:MAG: hydrogenase maturation protease [candidate division KSB1 bacterium]|nr:hydrogenase maturation protease [candidate division KSB1 bacterium]
MPEFNNDSPTEILILGIGNVLMGDEGIGVHVVRHLQNLPLPEGVECLDGGTGSFNLLEPMQRARKVILIDATIDGAPVGTVRRLTPRFSKDYPRTLAAHDIGLKDLLDAFYLLGNPSEVILFAVSVNPLQEMGTELSLQLADQVSVLAQMVVNELHRDPKEALR